MRVTSLMERGGFRMVQTDTLEVEYVELPVTETLTTFIYRILAPFPVAWCVDHASSVQILAETLHGVIKRKARERFIGLLYSSQRTYSLKQEFPWLFEITKVSLRECEIVSKDSGK